MAIESSWAIELDIRFSRAASTFTREADATTDAAIALPLAAFDDGSNFDDGYGWDDWPPVELLAIAERDEG